MKEKRVNCWNSALATQGAEQINGYLPQKNQWSLLIKCLLRLLKT